MDTNPLRTFAIPVEPIQFSTTPVVNHATSSKARGSKTGSAPTVPSGNAEQTEQSDSSATSPSADPDTQDLTQQDGETPSRGSVKNTAADQNGSTETQSIPNATAPSTPMNPQYPSQSSGNHPHLIPSFTPRSTPSGSLYQNLSSTGSSLIWKNSTSSLPNGTPRQLSKHSQVYTTPKGVIRADPWTSKHNDPTTTPGSVAPTEPENPGPVNPFSDTFPLVLDPPDLDEWRHKLFNVTDTLILSEEEYLTYFPHVDNVYSHRSTQRYKRKAFVSHYWDCRLKGRPSGTPKSDDPNKKKRKRQARERDLCDVKIKITEYFSAEEAAKQGLHTGTSDMPPLFNGNIAPELLGDSSGTVAVPSTNDEDHDLTIVLEDGSNNPTNPTDNFGLLELPRKFPKGHPGAEGKRWFAIQRVRGNPGGGALSEQKRNSVNGANGMDGGEDEDGDTSMLDPNMAADSNHKHSLEDSDRIKKNSIERWIIKEEKEKKRLSKLNANAPPPNPNQTAATESITPTFRASGMAWVTARSHAQPASSKITFFANGFCPFAQRVWIALELKGIPYQMVEIMPDHLDKFRPPEMLAVNPDGNIPCIKHGNWAIWESGVILEYLEDLSMGHPLLPLANPQLRAHCRLWTDHINRKILPSFYSLLLTPPPSPQSQLDGFDEEGDFQTKRNTAQHTMLVATLQENITSLVNASHATGPFFLGNDLGYVDVVFAPWIIRLSRVLSYYRNFPRPEVGTRWRRWVDAIEGDERIRRTISDENSYHGVYRGVGEDGWDSFTKPVGDEDGIEKPKAIVEIDYAKRVVAQEGFGLGGDVWGHLGVNEGDAEKRLTA
ncbi:hypothetical protein B0A52_03936 [Exophiala mesophila]|uniref:GST N-terminal domain-containing protein n=1 Tax=Exophiala mesophila TaxID=212818 RepID=A0A438N7M7_EXOME|nr:hypothetical protein B0A52_03936 [Exophiala mesophila]